MTGDRWELVSAWLNEWVAADADGRERLRARLAAEHPDLLPEAEALARSSGELDGFLETPALVLESAAIAAEEPALAAGIEIGPYRIDSLLARGGTGDVYRAIDIRLHRHVALKVLAQSRTADPQRVERFVYEARVTASLDHPHVVRVYDVGQSGGHAYLVAELLEGETLRERIARGAMPLDEALRVGLEVATGLSAAHAAGLVHRDLKPDNVFLTRAGVTKILDFGIAKLAPDHTGRAEFLTMTGIVLGTSGYLAPEQVLGVPVDPRADLFALGILLFEMLTGSRAFDREHLVDTLHAIVHEPPSDALATREDVPSEVAAIVMRLLAKAPDARFQSAEDVITALRRVKDLPPGGQPRPRRWSPWRRNAILAPTLVIGLAVALTAGVTMTTWVRSPLSAVVPAEPTRRPPGQKAQQNFLLGSAAARRITAEDLRTAAKYFEAAIALEPQYAAAWAGLASAYKRMPVTGAAPARVAFERARAAAKRALAIEPSNAEAVSTLGTIALLYDWQYERADELLNQALRLQPNHADSHLFLALLHESRGQFDEALIQIRRAQSADQQWAQLRALEGAILNTAGRHEDALQYLDTVIRDIDPGMWTTHMYRGDALLALGRTGEALAAYDHVLARTSHPRPLASRAVVLARMGRQREAEAMFARLPHEYHEGRATVLHALGRDDEAIRALHAAVDARDPLVTYLGVNRDWDTMRDRAAFRDVLRRVNLLDVSDRLRH